MPEAYSHKLVLTHLRVFLILSVILLPLCFHPGQFVSFSDTIDKYEDKELAKKSTCGIKIDAILLRNHTKYFRELGNIIYSRSFGVYIIAYSSFRHKYDGYHVYVGLAISKDLSSWVDIGEVVSHAEDPYLVEWNNTLYLFAEYKGPDNVHIGIGLWIANSLKNWSFHSLILRSQIIKDITHYDVSSPVVWYDKKWHTMFELRKRGFAGQIYMIDGESPTKWNLTAKLVLGENIYDNVVPDDLLLFNKSGLLLFHRFNNTKWVTHLSAFSPDAPPIEIYKDLPNDLMFYINTDPITTGKIYLMGIDKFKTKIVLYELDCSSLEITI